ncbi:MAG: NADPH-dependent oxidoreductase [Cyanobacteria bacterium RYN_339]|nr:NADPH-dependent oxidoreductase [Cyanobacteria bacterium RYN_339]
MLDRILEGAIRGTSSSGNMQAFSIIVTTDPALKQALYPLHFEQDMVLEAPAFVTFCADFHRMRRWLEASDAPDNFDNLMSFMIGAIDAILVAQSAALAAEQEGLGLCFLGTTLANCAAISEVLQLPANVVPVVGFSLGYAAEAPGPRDRLPTHGLVHRNVYQAPDVREIYEARQSRGWARYMQDDQLRAMVEASGVQNLAQLYTTVKYTRESHQAYSATILDCLERQNFLAG